jgi:hypothetical protein
MGIGFKFTNLFLIYLLYTTTSIYSIQNKENRSWMLQKNCVDFEVCSIHVLDKSKLILKEKGETGKSELQHILI